MRSVVGRFVLLGCSNDSCYTAHKLVDVLRWWACLNSGSTTKEGPSKENTDGEVSERVYCCSICCFEVWCASTATLDGVLADDSMSLANFVNHSEKYSCDATVTAECCK